MSTPRKAGRLHSVWVRAGRSRVLATRRRWMSMLVVAVLLIAAGVSLAVRSRSPRVDVTAHFVTGTPEPGGAPVRLDTSLYLPASTPAPAVLLAHGFGGSKGDLDTQARALAQAGYVVLAYTARGFGASGGLIHLDSRRYEVADGSRLLDFLQARPEVAKSGARPVLGVAGSSYGGALALMLAATDHRIGAVAADITWHSLSSALFPNSVVPSKATANGAGQDGSGVDAVGAVQPGGVFKRLWAGYLFSAGFTAGGPAAPSAQGAADPPGPDSGSPACGRFAAQLCSLYQQAASGQGLDAAFARLLADSSPASVLDHLRAPTLLTQGEHDSLFPLSEADANARQLAAAGAPVQVRWRSGGHDAPSADDDVAGWQRAFFNQRLRGKSGAGADFTLSQPGAGISSTSGRTVDTTLRAGGGYPGAGSARFATTDFPLRGLAQRISAPAGGAPAAVTSIPALGDLLGAASAAGVGGTAALSRLPGQTAIFSTDRLTAPKLITGPSKVSLTVTAGSTGRVTLFVGLHDVGPDGADTLPQGLVSPVLVTGRPGQTHAVTVQLPWIVAQVPSGHRLAVEVSTTDFSYQLPTAADTYRVALAGGAQPLSVSSVPVKVIRSGGAWGWVIAALVVVLLCLGYGLWRSRGRRATKADRALTDVPIVVTDLAKVYSDGYRAVDGVSFRVERGQVLGLLGPNGAGKTTTLRVLMGLIMPTSGSIRVFGEEIVPGAPVLARLGAFVEGPGFLPHLTGRENLRLYWAASGRPVEAAQFDTVLEIAGLGNSLNRRVKTYSHGMEQRLAIAQAMLGLPEVLVLDEPTNGLDPPQIAEMRVVLGRYAATGRTVIVSSHLLAEVEQTCTHVVVMHRGRLVAAGSVAEVAGAGSTQLAVENPARAGAVLAAAGISARAVPARRALEDVFLDLIGERNDS